MLATVFPLALNGFEGMMVLDDRADCPMTFCLEYHFRGRVEEALLTQALELSLPHHPLLCCRVERKGLSHQWVPLAEWKPVLETDRFAGSGIDLKNGPGFKLYLHHRGPKSVVTAEFHHAATDGLGGERFLSDLFTAYDGLSAGEPWRREPFDFGLLRDRLRRPSHWNRRESLESSGPGRWLRVAWKFLSRVPVVFHPGEKRDAESRPPMISRAFTTEQTARIAAFAGRRSCTVNDVGLVLLFRALADWRRRHGFDTPGRNIRVLMPTSLRDRRDKRLGAANRMAYSFLNLDQRLCEADFETLLTRVAEEKLFVQKHHPDWLLVQVIDKLYRWGILPIFLAMPYPFSTVVLTNLGKIGRQHGTEIGELELEYVTGTPPIRSGTQLSLALITCSGRLTLSLRSDPRYFSARQEEEIFRHLLSFWDELLVEESVQSQPHA